MSNESTETKKRRPRWPRVLVGLAVFLAVLLLVLQYALGPIVKTTAEQLGPKVLGTRVDVTNAHMRILSGLVKLDGVVVGPPEGFDANVFEMQNFRVDLDTSTLLGGEDDPIVIRDITIEGPFVTYELKGIRDNLHKLLSNLGADDDEEKPEEEKKEEKEEKKEGGRKVVIEHFLFKDAKVRVAVAGGKGAVVPLPDIELKDIGKSSGGATALDATGQILRQITIGTVVAVKDVLVDLGAVAADAVADAAVAVGDAAADAVGAAADAVGDAVGSAASAVTGAIGSLFGGGDDEKKAEEKAEEP
jgi:hypothetical protein